MAYLQLINQKTREFLNKIQNVDKDKLINRVIPVVTNTSFVLHSTKFLTPTLFSK